jgi:hypothetical protein
MTKLLEHAFAEAAKLPEPEQEALAALVLEEMASERRWAKAFRKSQQKLDTLADDALTEFKRGETRPFERDSDLAHN